MLLFSTRSHEIKLERFEITSDICFISNFTYIAKATAYPCKPLIMRQKYMLEYTLNVSPSILYARLSTPGGLSEWFADNVNMNGEVFTFHWNDSHELAEVLSKKDNRFVRYRWLDCEDMECYFEFRINLHELTGDVALEITDFCEEDEIEDATELWDTQIGKLKHILGL